MVTHLPPCDHKGISGKAAVIGACSGSSGRLVGDVGLHTVYKALKRTHNYLDRFYDYDYGKIPHWCKEFMRLNEGAR